MPGRSQPDGLGIIAAFKAGRFDVEYVEPVEAEIVLPDVGDRRRGDGRHASTRREQMILILWLVRPLFPAVFAECATREKRQETR